MIQFGSGLTRLKPPAYCAARKNAIFIFEKKNEITRGDALDALLYLNNFSLIEYYTQTTSQF